MSKKPTKNCVNCNHAEFYKSKSGRRNIKKGGECTFDAVLPFSLLNLWGDLPAKTCIGKHTGERMEADCPCWERLVK